MDTGGLGELLRVALIAYEGLCREITDEWYSVSLGLADV